MTEFCPCCEQPVKIGQLQLTNDEKRRFNWAGPNGSPNIIEAQCVKAAAYHYGIGDWTAFWDTEISVSENIENMRRQGNAPTMRELRGRI